MRSLLRALFTVSILSGFGAALALAQGPFNFDLLVTENGISNNVLNNQQIGVNAEVNTQGQVTVVATYVGTTAATITQPPSVLGSTEFTAKITATTTGSTALPIVLGPNQSITFVVTYAPTSAVAVSAQVSVAYTEPGTTTPTVSNAIILLFQGVSPSFTLSYVLPQANGTGNTVQIPSGGTIPFPATLLNTTSSATLDISNTGTGPGAIVGITQPPAGSPFKVFEIPLLGPTIPFPVAAGMSLPLLVEYTPTAVGTSDTAQITISFQDGTKSTVNFTGTGIASTFSYSYLSGTGTTPTAIAPGGTITFMPVNVATAGTTPASSTAIVQVKNTGAVSTTLSGASVQGQGFQLVNQVSTAPVLAPGGAYSFAVSYTPTQPGTQTGQLAVGSDVFTLSGQGLGPSLTFSYTSPAGTVSVVPPNAVIFSPIGVSQSEKVTFILTNSGTSATTISSIGVSAPGTINPFSLTPAPALPLMLAAGQSSQFTITFTPASTGYESGTLQIDNTAVPLLGSGTAPPTLPSYTITGPSGNATPASQANVSLTLANSYPVDLNGVLTLTTSGNYGTDSAVQFATGSTAGNRTVDFTIAANTTSADFVGQGSQIPLQTGTVAETVTLTPSFTTAEGLDVTPASPAALQFTVASAAPVVESLSVTDLTASSFTLLIDGYSTIRSLTSLNVTFTAASGYHLTTSQFTLDVSGPANVWFQSNASQSFGGLFQITVPFNLPGNVPVGKTLTQAIASVTITLANSVGTSNSLQANIQ